MPKAKILTMKKASRGQRLLIWFSRHKILSVLPALLLAGVLYFGASEVVWQTQVNQEKQRFFGTNSNMLEVNSQIKGMFESHLKHYCYYTSSTAEFTQGSRFCVIRLTATGVNIDEQNALKKALALKELLIKDGYGLTGVHLSSTQNLVSQQFEDNKIDCSYDFNYYTADIPIYDRTEGAPTNGSAYIAEIICSKSAKTEYFSLIK